MHKVPHLLVHAVMRRSCPADPAQAHPGMGDSLPGRTGIFVWPVEGDDEHVAGRTCQTQISASRRGNAPPPASDSQFRQCFGHLHARPAPLPQSVGRPRLGGPRRVCRTRAGTTKHLSRSDRHRRRRSSADGVRSGRPSIVALVGNSSAIDRRSAWIWSRSKPLRFSPTRFKAVEDSRVRRRPCRRDDIPARHRSARRQRRARLCGRTGARRSARPGWHGRRSPHARPAWRCSPG